MSDQSLHPAIEFFHTIAVWLFVVTTWGVAVFFLIDYWAWIRSISLVQLSITLIVFAVLLLMLTTLWMGRIVSLKQIIQFFIATLFFLSLAVLYSYVGMKIGKQIRGVFNLNIINEALTFVILYSSLSGSRGNPERSFGVTSSVQTNWILHKENEYT